MNGLVIVGSIDNAIQLDLELIAVFEQILEPRRSEVLWTVLRPNLSSVEVESWINNNQPEFVHFLGHGRVVGDKVGLVLQGSGGRDTWLLEEVKSALGKSKPRLVLLNACRTAATSPGIDQSACQDLADVTEGVVIGYGTAVAGIHASLFSRGFYKSLSFGKDVDTAVRAGLARIRTSSDPRADADADAVHTAFGGSTNKETRLLPAAPPNAGKRGQAQSERVNWETLDFTNRTRQQLELWRHLDGESNGLVPPTRVVVLSGPTGSGKTTFALHALERPFLRGHTVRYADFQAGAQGIQSVPSLLRALCIVEGRALDGRPLNRGDLDAPLPEGCLNEFWSGVRTHQEIGSGVTPRERLPGTALVPSKLDELMRAFAQGLSGIGNPIYLVLDHVDRLPPEVLHQRDGGLARLVRHCARVDSIRLVLVIHKDEVSKVKAAIGVKAEEVKVPLIEDKDFLDFGREFMRRYFRDRVDQLLRNSAASPNALDDFNTRLSLALNGLRQHPNYQPPETPGKFRRYAEG